MGPTMLDLSGASFSPVLGRSAAPLGGLGDQILYEEAYSLEGFEGNGVLHG